MKLNKKVNRYCSHCKKHSPHEISLAKRKERGSLKRGSLKRGKKRGRGRNFGNKGKWGSKPPITQYKRTGAKQSKKHDLRYRCTVCNKMSVQSRGWRAKKLEIT